MVVLALGVTAWGCSGDGGEAGPPTTGEATTTAPPTATARWLDQFDGLTPAGEVDGKAVAVDEDERTVYVEDCDVARRITSSGGPYAASARDDEGNFTPGYGFVCSE
jgi:hypothetical protein